MRVEATALAESYAQLRVHGLSQVLVGIRFPISAGYATVSQLMAEGVAIGNITLGGMLFKVSVAQGPWEGVPR